MRGDLNVECIKKCTPMISNFFRQQPCSLSLSVLAAANSLIHDLMHQELLFGALCCFPSLPSRELVSLIFDFCWFVDLCCRHLTYI